MAQPLRWLSCAGGLALALTAAAQITPSGGGYLMRVKYTKGTTLKYSTTTTMVNSKNQSAPAMKATAPIVLKVLDVKNGKAQIKTSLGPIMLGKQQVQPMQTTTMVLNTRNSGSSGDSKLMNAEMPLKPVKVGQTWTTKAPIPDSTGMMGDIKALYKFDGLKTVSGSKMAQISYRLTRKANGSGTLLMLASDGTLFSNKARITMNMGANGTMIINTEFVRH